MVNFRSIQRESTRSDNIQEVSRVASLSLLGIFKQYKAKEFIFVEPGGNAGDYLIYKGAQKLAKLAGLSYKTVSNDEFMKSQYPSDSIIYIHGSGGYIPCWGDNASRLFVKAITTYYGIVILGPTTFSEDCTFLKHILGYAFRNMISERVVIFARECTSYSVLKEIVPKNVELILDHDTAFNLTVQDLIKAIPKQRYVLYAIREDKEAIDVPKRNLLAVWLDPINLKHLNFKQWIFIHSRAKKIITNRCHSAILGSLLDIPVIILPNSYHKNRSVWEYSLSKRGVEWSDVIPINKTSFILSSISFVNKFISSNLCQRSIKLFFGTGYKKLNSPSIDNIVF